MVRKALDAERMHAQNSQVIDEFRRNGGHVGGNFEGAPVLLLHTIGAKSGTERINPMMYQQVGDAYAVFASAAGDDDHPAWFHNRAVFDRQRHEPVQYRPIPFIGSAPAYAGSAGRRHPITARRNPARGIGHATHN
jgi:hypothetical protein